VDYCNFLVASGFDDTLKSEKKLISYDSAKASLIYGRPNITV